MSLVPLTAHFSQEELAPSHPGSFWQECPDPNSGYPYYWNTNTNQVIFSHTGQSGNVVKYIL